MKVCPNLPDTIHFNDTEVMRITSDGVWVNPDMQVDETAKAVLDALSSQVKVLVQRAEPVDETAKDRLVRIMGTFDLATGHADTLDQALDALEEELRDVLGHLRARQQQEPFIYIREDTEMPFGGYEHCGQYDAGAFPVYLAPPKRDSSSWVWLTDADIAQTMHGSVEGSNMLPYQFARAIEAKLKEKNVPQP